MPLSKARDRERKRLARLEKRGVQPKPPEAISDPVQPKFQPIGMLVRPTASQKAEWAKFKAGQR